MPIRHADQSGREDNTDPGAIQPSHWNKNHLLTGLLALIDAIAPSPNTLFTLDGTGAPVMATLSPFMRARLADVSAAAFQIGAGAAPLSSPHFTDVPTAPTAALGTNTDQIATMAAVQAAITALIGGAPGALDTLQELAAAIGNNASYAAAITTALGNRLRFDAVQSLSSPQRIQLMANLALAYADISGLGTAATLNFGTGPANVPQLDGSSRLPAVDGSRLTNLPSGESIGSISFIPGTTAPEGKLKANGPLLSRATYAALWTYAQASGNIVTEAAWTTRKGSFSTGDTATTFRAPDLRGIFIRGFDDGAGVDSGRVIGSSQADDLKLHNHTPPAGSTWFVTTAAGGGGSYGSSGGGLTGSTNTANAGGTETRPANVALLACIKYVP